MLYYKYGYLSMLSLFYRHASMKHYPQPWGHQMRSSEENSLELLLVVPMTKNIWVAFMEIGILCTRRHRVIGRLTMLKICMKK